MRRNLLVLAVALLSLAFAVPSARAMGFDPGSHFTTLKDLANGDSITSRNGELEFSDFEITTTGSVRRLSLFKVIRLDDGFAIRGPIVAAGGKTGGLLIEYTVTSSSPINAATLRFNGVAFGQGSSAHVVETFGEGPEVNPLPVDIELFVFALGAGGKDRTESVNLEGLTELRVMKDIVVNSDKKGIAAISWISQRFRTGTAPEPASMLLIGLALLTVHTARRRRD